MHLLAHTRLQRKLILAFAVVLLIPTVVISAYNLVRARELSLHHAGLKYQHLAEKRAIAAEALLVESGADLLLAAQAPAVRRWARDEPDAIEAVAAHFTALLQRSGGRYSGLCILALDGRELVCVRDAGGQITRVPEAALASRSSEPFLPTLLQQAALRGSQPVHVAPLDLAAPGGPLLHYAALVEHERGGGAGVIVLELRADALIELLTAREPGVSTFIVDSEGTYLLHPDRELPLWPGAPTLYATQPHDAALLLRSPGGVLVASADRPGELQAFVQVRPDSQSALQWTLVYTRPIAGVLGEVWKTQIVIIVITVGALIVALLVADLLARDIVRPIRELAAAAERVGSGDLRALIPCTGNDEIGALGRTFDRTVARLRDAIAAAEGQRHEAETLRAATQALSSTLALDRVLDLILSELRKVVPYDSASVQVVHGATAEIIGAYGLNRGDQVIGSHFALIPGATPNAEVAAARAPLILHDAPAHFPIFNTEPYRDDPIHSWLGVPLLFGERMIGMVTMDKHEVGFFTPEHARLAVAFAAQAAIAMENARLYEAAQRELAERRRAEAAHARLAAIIEATTDFVGIFDPAGRILYLNRAGRQLIGLELDAELTGMRIADFVSCQGAASPLDAAVATTLQAGSWIGEMTLRSRDGEEIPVSQVMIAQYGHNGRPEYLATIIRDMRERRRAEEEQRQSQKMEALGRLAGGLAHDFNNLLTVILGEADILLDDLRPADPLRTSVEQIRQSGSRAAALTRQLLAFSRRQVLQPELIDLNEVIAGMDQMLRRLIGEDITLTIMLSDDLPPVRADPGQIAQVVMNLAINARDAMPDGGRLLIETVTTSLAPDDTQQHSSVLPGPHAVLSVTDTGIGIDPETRDQIFEPFFTTKPRGSGTGLGLATVHGIVRQSGGQIWFYSEPGHGTTFKVYLPAAEGAVRPVPELEPAVAPSRAVGTVLLVEDDEGVRLLVRQILIRAGFTVLEASDGQAALELAATHTAAIDLLLTDVVMPGGLNGVQLASALRLSRPETAIVYMSGYTENARVERSVLEDGGRFIQKPFTPDTLVAALLEALTALDRPSAVHEGERGRG